MSEFAEQLNREIFGFTNVLSITLRNDESDTYRGYSLQLLLESNQNERIELVCRNVSGFRIREFGGGLNQFLGLLATDVRSKQLERVALRFTDSENDKIYFDCSAAEVKQVH
jgi:hypothetical protein